MVNPGDNLATITAHLRRFQSYRLPRALEIKAKVDAGGYLDDFDIQFLERVLLEREAILQLVRRHPEYKGFYVRKYVLYKEIVCRSIQNEKKATEGKKSGSDPEFGV